MFLTKNYEFTSDAMKFICFIDSLLLILCQPWKPSWVAVVIVSEGRQHRPITVLNEPCPRSCSAQWCKMHVNTSPVGDEVFN